jgi:hypothetical protein
MSEAEGKADLPADHPESPGLANCSHRDAVGWESTTGAWAFGSRRLTVVIISSRLAGSYRQIVTLWLHIGTVKTSNHIELQVIWINGTEYSLLETN